MNGTAGNLLHFTNRNRAQVLNIIGVGFEQAVAGGKYLFIEDTHGIDANTINIDGCRMAGNPAGGGHVSIDLQRTRRVTLRALSSEADQSAANWTLRMDANCRGLEADMGCRFMDPVSHSSPAISIAPGVDRDQIVFPDRAITSQPVLTGYNGSSHSTSAIILDMASLLSGRFPTHGVSPVGYTIQVRTRDSGSSGTVNRGVEFGQFAGVPTEKRALVSLDGVRDDKAITETFYVPADTDGSIWMNITASGVDTLDLWIFVLKIHN